MVTHQRARDHLLRRAADQEARTRQAWLPGHLSCGTSAWAQGLEGRACDGAREVAVHVSGAGPTTAARVRARLQSVAERLLARTGRRWPPWRRPTATGRPLERLVSDLRRLGTELRDTEHSAVMYRVDRMRALSLAYDCTLLDCCRLLEVATPGRPPWTPVDRLQVESGLAMAGLVW